GQRDRGPGRFQEQQGRPDRRWSFGVGEDPVVQRGERGDPGGRGQPERAGPLADDQKRQIEQVEVGALANLNQRPIVRHEDARVIQEEPSWLQGRMAIVDQSRGSGKHQTVWTSRTSGPSSSRMSSTVSTKRAPSRIRRWQPRLARLSTGPGTAKTSRFCSMAWCAVDSDPLRGAASTTRTPQAKAGNDSMPSAAKGERSIGRSQSPCNEELLRKKAKRK